MGARARIDIDLGEIEGSLRSLGERAPIVIAGIVERRADMGEEFMRNNAPWTDRTGNARAGLRAKASHSVGQSAIDFFHSMPYGIWLEVRWAGRYGIIPRTILEMGQGMMEDVSALLRRL